jgi:hypothetical protein
LEFINQKEAKNSNVALTSENEDILKMSWIELFKKFSEIE